MLLTNAGNAMQAGLRRRSRGRRCSWGERVGRGEKRGKKGQKGKGKREKRKMRAGEQIRRWGAVPALAAGVAPPHREQPGERAKGVADTQTAILRRQAAGEAKEQEKGNQEKRKKRQGREGKAIHRAHTKGTGKAWRDMTRHDKAGARRPQLEAERT